ncbi:lipoyl(octanoyl) transferase LipB [Buchnera aphidicola]|uniref:Octanoyltransferase n=1 Tax=Buchnera aphidicola str. Ua (Uroleucon ambrosiae) TaxID=1005057 RepID=G2LPD0_BUCUM|nr:lipoyl(octanoyl) transferase LipB [Buchnera aphidicola]AEO08067.1 lipoyltransferase [Buchnera aphidicola str. Ua (Uroleucon ambrosiae)]
MQKKIIFFRNLGIQNYLDIFQEMNNFTISRNINTFDEIWFVEHYPIFTQGVLTQKNNILYSSSIPIVNTDRGGKITYHGPGQQILYFLIDLVRRKISIRQFINIIQNIIIATLNYFSISAYTKQNMPGVYVNKKKICSLGLRIKKGSTLHGLALNVDMNLQPFEDIHPCGDKNIKMTQIKEFNKKITIKNVKNILIKQLSKYLEVNMVNSQYQNVIINSGII